MAVQLLQLIVYHSPIFPAHWALFLPTSDDPKLGKRFHADGSPLTGFEALFETKYNLRECTQSYDVFDIGEVNEEKAERVARNVPAPVKSLVAASAPVPRRRVHMKNCQTWVKDVVARLIEQEIIGREAVLIMKKVPLN